VLIREKAIFLPQLPFYTNSKKFIIIVLTSKSAKQILELEGQHIKQLHMPEVCCAFVLHLNLSPRTQGYSSHIGTDSERHPLVTVT